MESVERIFFTKAFRQVFSLNNIFFSIHLKVFRIGFRETVAAQCALLEL